MIRAKPSGYRVLLCRPGVAIQSGQVFMPILKLETYQRHISIYMTNCMRKLAYVRVCLF
jgi:hypothetical protein